MKNVLFVLGGGIGNLIQATPAIKAVSENGWDVDVLAFCNSTQDLDILKINAISKFHTKPPNKRYNYQLNGPFTPGTKYSCDFKLTTRINYAQHIPEYMVYYDLAKQIGVNTPPPATEINIGDNGPWPKNTETVAIYPGSKPNWSMKRWDKYDKLAEMFNNVVVIGTQDDINSHGNPAWIKRKWEWPENTEFFSGTLQQSAFLISKCKMFIGNDGGLSHVAAATGVPTYIIFGPSSEIKNKPSVGNAKVIATNINCRPCQFREHNGKQIFGANIADCQNKMACMNKMTVNYVIQHIDK